MVCEKKCPDRKAGCKISCEKWQAYEAEYFAERKEKEKIYAQQDDINSYEKERILRSKRWRNDK